MVTPLTEVQSTISKRAGASSLSRPPVARMIDPLSGSLYWGALATPSTWTPAGTLRFPLTRYFPGGRYTLPPSFPAASIAAWIDAVSSVVPSAFAPKSFALKTPSTVFTSANVVDAAMVSMIAANTGNSLFRAFIVVSSFHQTS